MKRQFPHFTVDQLIRVVEVGGVRGGCCGHDSIPSGATLGDLGIIFLTGDDANERARVEMYFRGLLGSTDDRYLLFPILCFLMHCDAMLTEETRIALGEYIANPANESLVTRVRQCLERD